VLLKDLLSKAPLKRYLWCPFRLEEKQRSKIDDRDSDSERGGGGGKPEHSTKRHRALSLNRFFPHFFFHSEANRMFTQHNAV
jgi:hypothetical protein